MILRHQPERLGLLRDERGWVSLAAVVEILAGLPNFRWANRPDVRQIFESGAGDLKRRFELADGRIRACHGHSFDSPRIQYDPCTPPRLLHHGRSPDDLAPVHCDGLRPMTRQYVHLAGDQPTAVRIGARHALEPVVPTMPALEAWRAGIEFYQADESVYLARTVPPQFID